MPPRPLSAVMALVGVVAGGIACSTTRRPEPSSTDDVSSSLALLASAPTAVASSVQSPLLPPPSAAQPFPVPIPTAVAAPLAPASTSSPPNRVACQQACLKACSAQSHECDQRAGADRGELRRCGSRLIGCRSDCLRDSAPCP